MVQWNIYVYIENKLITYMWMNFTQALSVKQILYLQKFVNM